MVKQRFSSRLAGDEITTRGYKALTFAKCTTHDNRASGYKQYGILSRLDGMVFGVAYVKSCDPYCPFFHHTSWLLI
jgi:hypothetical protein